MKIILTLAFLTLLTFLLYSRRTRFGNIEEIRNTARKSCIPLKGSVRQYPSGHIPGSRLIITKQEEAELNKRW